MARIGSSRGSTSRHTCTGGRQSSWLRTMPCPRMWPRPSASGKMLATTRDSWFGLETATAATPRGVCGNGSGNTTMSEQQANAGTPVTREDKPEHPSFGARLGNAAKSNPAAWIACAAAVATVVANIWFEVADRDEETGEINKNIAIISTTLNTVPVGENGLAGRVNRLADDVNRLENLRMSSSPIHKPTAPDTPSPALPNVREPDTPTL